MDTKKYIVPVATFTEKPEEYELKVQLPGTRKEDAELHIENRTLTLKTHTAYQAPAGFRQVVAEFEHANYAMSVDLPEMADPSALAAKIENGILTVVVKKRAETQAKRSQIA